MRGFEDSANPVLLNLDPTVNALLGNVANTAYTIDGSQAEANTYGILVNVSGTRYFIPWQKVYMIRQVQAVIPPAAPAIPFTPPVVVPPKND